MITVRFVALLALLCGVAVNGCGNTAPDGVPGIPSNPEELRAACAGARPDWTSYTEDLKGALGATPVAQWEGLPESARRNGASLYITFSIEPPWDTYSFGLPVLLRDPFGEVRHPDGFEAGETSGVYRYDLDDVDPTSPLPWVEVKFPREQIRRLVLDSSGTWRREGAG